AWRERWLDHPLAGTLAKRLIWRFDDGGNVVLGTWHDGRLVDVTGTPFDALPETVVVSLWHPIESDAATVLAWRHRLIERGVTQPFKQAHREIYVVTDAERATGTYS